MKDEKLGDLGKDEELLISKQELKNILKVKEYLQAKGFSCEIKHYISEPDNLCFVNCVRTVFPNIWEAEEFRQVFKGEGITCFIAPDAHGLLEDNSIGLSTNIYVNPKRIQWLLKIIQPYTLLGKIEISISGGEERNWIFFSDKEKQEACKQAIYKGISCEWLDNIHDEFAWNEFDYEIKELLEDYTCGLHVVTSAYI